MFKFFNRILLLSFFEFSLCASPISYSSDVQPVLEKRCAVCHSCYNAPCQLKMETFEGIDRGANKKSVYDALRLSAVQPTRLFMDANSTQEWRKKEFFSITGNADYSTLRSMLELKKTNPLPVGNYYAESEVTTCVRDRDEMDRYAKKHPAWGMPFGVPALKSNEHKLLVDWLDQGAKGPSDKEDKLLKIPSKEALVAINKWEEFLNQDEVKHNVTARYLYEHLFLAHIYFGEKSGREFFELVRSSTPYPKPISVVATVRPYDDPKVTKVYYRFRKIHGTLTHKTHMTLMLDEKKLQKYTQLFIDSIWPQTPNRLDYNPIKSANPLTRFVQIPALSRYEFLLEHSQYIVDTFIRGPVCKGQLALNSIEDHFWVMFMDPAHDLGVKYDHFYSSQKENLAIPNEAGSSMKIYKIFSDDYKNGYADYYKAKLALYDLGYPDGLPLDAIWQGEKSDDAPILTVYRHFDSASVHRGVRGELPKTAWVMDYAQLERTYYALVAGFDVFGNVSHQTNIRRFMDFIRLDGELNFIHFLPKDKRYEIIKSWYLGDSEFEEPFEELKNTVDTKVVYTQNEVKRELMEKVVEHHILSSTNIHFDPLNYFRLDEEFPPLPIAIRNKKDALQGFRALMKPGMRFVEMLNKLSVDVILIRIIDEDSGDHFVSMIVNRWHDSINTMFKENSKFNPSKDTIDFFEENIASYPNYFFVVDKSELGDFFDLIQNYEDNDVYNAKVLKYGINRSDGRFWETYDWFQEYFNKDEPINAALYDLNRYHQRAF